MMKIRLTMVSILVAPLVAACGGPDVDFRGSEGDEDTIGAAPRHQGAAPVASGVQETQGVAPSRDTATVINGLALENAAIRSLEDQGIQVVPGRFWYDPASGAFGPEGGPTAGFTMPGLRIGGPLQPDASGGGTWVYLNGREMHPAEVAGLGSLLGPIEPGRYWMDAMGNFGIENGPMLGNLVRVLQAAGGGVNAYIRETYGGYVGGDGQTSYYFDPNSGCSVIAGEGVSC